MMEPTEFVARAKAINAQFDALIAEYEAPPPGPPIIHLTAGQDLQTALDTAPEGATVKLEPDATWYGRYEVKTRGLSIERDIGSSGMAQLRSPGNEPAIRVLAPDVTLYGVRVLANELAGGTAIAVGSNDETDMDAQPSRVALNWVHVVVEDGQQLKRGIAWHGRDGIIRQTTVIGVNLTRTETQALWVNNTPGGLLVEDSHLEAASINVLVGGAPQQAAGVVPSDLTFRRTTLSKRAAWKTADVAVKNLFELKAGRRIVVEECDLDGSWTHGQDGYGVLFTAKDQNRTSPWVCIEDVDFRRNRVRNVGSGVKLSSVYRERQADGTWLLHPCDGARRIRIADNLFIIDRNMGVAEGRTASAGKALQLSGPIDDVTVMGNTFISNGSHWWYNDTDQNNPALVSARLHVAENVAFHGQYGFNGYQTTGNPLNTLARYFADPVFARNVIAGGSAVYPTGTQRPTVDDLRAAFHDYAAGDYRLRPESAFAGMGWSPVP